MTGETNMKVDQPNLVTPFYIKTSKDMPWPGEERAFYIVSSNGLYLCRNNPYFCSSVPAPRWPSELSTHGSSLSLRYPKIPQGEMEQMVGFFDRMTSHHHAEAAALLVLEEETGRVRFHVPPQTVQVGVNRRGRRYPIGVTYETDPAPPAGHVVVGDIHSHCYAAAYSSAIDRHDETYRPGLHIVVGRIDWEPPQFRCEFVVDGTRFTVQEDKVLEGYTRRCYDVPVDWTERVKVEVVDEWSREATWGRKGKTDRARDDSDPAPTSKGEVQ